MLAAKSEKHAFFATLWFNIAFYAVRPWPWILTGLACILIFPHAAKGEEAYIQCIDFVPAGLKGLVLAGFFAALMAIDTRLNLGAAYFVNDFYRPYLVSNRDDRHYVFVSRLATCGQVLLGLLYALAVNRVKTAFYLTTAIGSGAGLVYALRWYWWRVSAWSEIAALTAALVNAAIFRFVIYPTESQFNDHGLQILLFSGITVTSVWLIVTLLTPPSNHEQLRAFYTRVRPAGPFWGPIAREVAKDIGPIDPGYSIARGLIAWVCATGMVLSVLFGSGKLFLGQPMAGAILLTVGAMLCGVVLLCMRRAGVAQSEPVLSA
jgi:Na+/proline symporter